MERDNQVGNLRQDRVLDAVLGRLGRSGDVDVPDILSCRECSVNQPHLTSLHPVTVRQFNRKFKSWSLVPAGMHLCGRASHTRYLVIMALRQRCIRPGTEASLATNDRAGESQEMERGETGDAPERRADSSHVPQHRRCLYKVQNDPACKSFPEFETWATINVVLSTPISSTLFTSRHTPSPRPF